MKELLLKKSNANGEDSLSIVGAVDCNTAYVLIEKAESLLTGTFAVQTESGENVADIKREHVLFTPAKMPKVSVSMKDGKHFIIRKELEELREAFKIEGEELTIKGELFSEHYELFCGGKCIAVFDCNDEKKAVFLDENYETMVISFVFAAELAR